MFAVCLFLLSFMGDEPNAKLHDLKDGTVKIATQVTVEEKQTTVKYDVGFNPVTLDQLLKEMEIEVADDGKREEKVEKLRAELSKKITSTLKVEIDGHEATAVEVKTEPNEISKHVQISISLVFGNPSTDRFEVKVTDTGFQKQSQIYSSGFKTKGPDLAVVESSTEAITIRSKPTEKPADETSPYVIIGKIKSLKSASVSVEEDSSSIAPLIVVAFALGAAGIVGLLLVPNDLSSSSDHDDHH